MNNQQVESLLQYRMKHPKITPLDCYNRWHATQNTKFNIYDIKEAMFLAQLNINTVINAIQEVKNAAQI